MSLDTMRARMNAIGGATNDGRINNGKLESLKAAMRNSYQAEWIHLKGIKNRCLINPVKQSPDYDQKEISIEFKSGIKVGDTFYWDRTDTHWMVINQRLTEEAYFRGEIRQCDYEIETDNSKYWVWLRGPVETDLVWKQKHQITWNEMNYTLLMYIPKNDDTNSYFKRHKIVKFDNHNWRVAAVDRYSQEAIIEVYLEEYNDNEMADAQVTPVPEEVDTTNPYIEGEAIVNPYDTDLVYTVKMENGGSWDLSGSRKATISAQDDVSCTIDIITGKSGSLTLNYVKNDTIILTKEITIVSL